MVWPNSDSQKCDKWSQRVLRDHHSHLPPSLTRPPVLTFPRDLRNQESFLDRRQRPLACECFRSIPKLLQRKRRCVIHHTPKSFVTSPSLNFHRVANITAPPPGFAIIAEYKLSLFSFQQSLAINNAMATCT